MKLPKELLEKNKKKRLKHNINRRIPISKDKRNQSRKNSEEQLINETIKWMKKYNPKDILTWIEVISIHPSNQIFQIRFEFLIAILVSIEPKDFQNNALSYNVIKKFIQVFEKKNKRIIY